VHYADKRILPSLASFASVKSLSSFSFLHPWGVAPSWEGGRTTPVEKESLVLQVRVLFILSAMNQKHRFWLLALFLATLAFTSCLNQEGVGPAEGELKTPGSTGIQPQRTGAEA
jgi:hypothetical protein